MSVRFALVVTWLFVSACTVDVPDAGSGEFACETNDDCADGYVCSGTPLRCRKPNDTWSTSCYRHSDCSGTPETPYCDFTADPMYCVDPCERHPCENAEDVCLVDLGTLEGRVCEPCNTANFCPLDGDGNQQVCVRGSPAVTPEYICRPTCGSSQPGEPCEFAGMSGYCGQIDGVSACHACPTCDTDTCAVNPTPAHYDEIAICSGGACTNNTECGTYPYLFCNADICVDACLNNPCGDGGEACALDQSDTIDGYVCGDCTADGYSCGDNQVCESQGTSGICLPACDAAFASQGDRCNIDATNVNRVCEVVDDGTGNTGLACLTCPVDCASTGMECATTGGTPPVECACRSKACTWAGLGDSNSGEGVPGDGISRALPEIEIDGSTGNVWVAWVGTTNVVLQARYFDGSTWNGLYGSESGGIAVVRPGAGAPRMRLDSTGTPGFTLVNSSGAIVYVFAKQSSAVWESSPSLDYNTELGYVPDVAHGPDGPFVLWRVGPVAGQSLLRGKRATGDPMQSWSPIIAGTGYQGVVYDNGDNDLPRMAARTGVGYPLFVAWQHNDATAGTHVYAAKVMSASDPSPVELGGSFTVKGLSSAYTAGLSPAIAVDSMGYPVVAFRGEVAANDERVIVLRWDGGTWLGPSGNQADDVGPIVQGQTPALAMNGDNPVVAWHGVGDNGKTQVFVSTYDGTGWVSLSSPNGVSQSPNGIGAQIDVAAGSNGSAGTQVCVAWQELNPLGTGVDEIYVACNQL